MESLTTQKKIASDSAQTDVTRVMIVDDSPIVRKLVRRWLSAANNVEIVAACRNGREALQQLSRTDPDVITLDIEMPEMDGLTALPKILEQRPDVKIIMSSTLTQRNADIALQAMSLGAADYIAKPSTSDGLNSSDNFSSTLIDKVHALGRARRKSQQVKSRPSPPPKLPSPKSLPPLAVKTKTVESNRFSLRPISSYKPNIVAIASSTGGPQAVTKLLKDLAGANLPPIIITQHMPKTFTTLFADHLNRGTPFDCCEGHTGQIIEPGHVYIAPGGYHMLVETDGTSKKLLLTQTEPENYCRPAADPMLRSVAEVFGNAALVVVLTGMGHDGRDGAAEVSKAGGTIIAQDEESSVVWGMPGAVTEAGLCSSVLALDDLAETVRRIATK